MRQIDGRTPGAANDGTGSRSRTGNRSFGIIVLFCVCVTLQAFPAVGPPLLNASADGGTLPPVVVTFENPYGPVVFNHEAHHGLACSECHPPFDFKLDPGFGYSLRAHGLCVSCHEKSSVAAKCSTCHSIRERTGKPFDPAIMKSDSEQRQEVLDLFYKRRSIRKFQDRQVADEVVRDLLKAAMAAPTAGNWQPWEFVVVRDEQTRTALSMISPFAKFVKNAPVIICIVGKNDNHWAIFDCTLAAGNIMLTAAGFDLGTTYCGLDREREGKGREILGIPDGYTLYALIPVGYPAESKKPHTKYNPDRVHWEHFQAGRPETVVGE